MYAVLSMRGNSQCIDNSVCRAELDKCTQRRRLIFTPEEYRKKPQNSDFHKKTVTILRQSLHGKKLFSHVSNSCFVGYKHKEIQLKSQNSRKDF